MIQTILVPFDTSTNTELVVECATAIAHAASGRLILYSVIPDEGLRNHAEHQIARAAGHAEQVGVSIATRIEFRTDVATGIVETPEPAKPT